MGRKSDLSETEKNSIVTQLEKGSTTLEIAKMINRDHRTVKKYIEDPDASRTRSDKGKSRVITQREVSRIKRIVWKKNALSSKTIFEEVNRGNVSKSSRCRILRHVANCVKLDITPSLKSKTQNEMTWMGKEVFEIWFQCCFYWLVTSYPRCTK